VLKTELAKLELMVSSLVISKVSGIVKKMIKVVLEKLNTVIEILVNQLLGVISTRVMVLNILLILLLLRVVL